MLYGRRRSGGTWTSSRRRATARVGVRNIGVNDRYRSALIGISDDEKQLFWLDSQSRESAAVTAQTLPAGKPRVLVGNRSTDFGIPVLDPVRRTPIAASLIYTRRRWYTIDPLVAPDLDRLQASIDGDIADFNLSNDRSNWIVMPKRQRARATSTTAALAVRRRRCSRCARSTMRRW